MRGHSHYQLFSHAEVRDIRIQDTRYTTVTLVLRTQGVYVRNRADTRNTSISDHSILANLQIIPES